MLTEIDLSEHFENVTRVGDAIFRGEDRFAEAVIYYYFALRPHLDLLLVSEDLVDDKFAVQLLSSIQDASPSKFHIESAPANEYGFTHVALAPKDYHGELKGRLDEKRQELVLCVPCYKCEFSESESAAEFRALRTEIIPALRWRREVFPKIMLRYHNPKTGGGTDNYVPATFGLVVQEIDSLRGVTDGFIEIKNYKNEIMEILSSLAQSYTIIRDRDDSERLEVGGEGIGDIVWRFLTIA